VSLQDDYFDLESELTGENKKRFLRIWEAFCELEAESEQLLALRGSLRRVIEIVGQSELQQPTPFPYNKLTRRSRMAIRRVRQDPYQPDWIRKLAYPWTCEDFMQIGWLQMSSTRGVGPATGINIAKALASVGYSRWLNT